MFYHVAVMSSWKISHDIVEEHIRGSGITEICDDIYYCINGNIDEARSYINPQSPKEKFIHLSDHVNNWEFPTLNYLRENCFAEDMYVLYIHTKGASCFVDEPRRGGTSGWLDAMAFNCISKYKECLAALESGYDCSGYGFNRYPFVHYSGNAWWAQSDHIKKLVKLDYDKKVFDFNIDFSHRHDAEKWVCSFPGKFHNMEYLSYNHDKYKNCTF